MGGELGSGALGAEGEAPAEAREFFLRAFPLHTREYFREYFGEKFVASHLGDSVRLVPGEREGERQCDAREEFSLPAGVEGVVGKNEFEDVAEG